MPTVSSVSGCMSVHCPSCAFTAAHEIVEALVACPSCKQYAADVARAQRGQGACGARKHTSGLASMMSM